MTFAQMTLAKVARTDECGVSSQNILPQGVRFFSREVGSQMDVVNDASNPARLTLTEQTYDHEVDALRRDETSVDP